MKTRNGFVSNSSSSSFVILKDDLTGTQLDLIRDHANCGKICADTDSWTISEDNYSIRARTWMDNFDFQEYLEEIGVADKHIKWE